VNAEEEEKSDVDRYSGEKKFNCKAEICREHDFPSTT
jgi:hypothetical protein